ncbi:peroxisomal membrane protein PEX14 isoform X2 [Carica papaya]|uniref:peroxisomal membrane protein PEX14 isoform X2 n=1 Tax=Carica papaya TaxID=3649 RepID=UPI000B8C966F|nr:peroxisomal membrane protein PEX14 isoform X2 [Carica papaya]
MASQPTAPPNPSDDKPQNSESVQSANEVQQDAKAEATKPNVATSVFVNSEPMREEQVQNAVKFLSHPKVRGSPVMYRRSFLERKGLTKEEIDEAFRRVPDPPPSAQTATMNQDGQAKTSSNTQSQAPAQTLQPVAAVPNTVAPSVGTLTKSRFHWYHAVIAVGVLAASGAGTAVLLKKAIIPRLKSWIRRVVQEEENDLVKKANAKPSLAEEAAAAAKAAAAAAADVAKASQEMLNSKTEERRYFGELMSLLDVQVQEMKSMSNAIRKLEGQTNNSGSTYVADQEDYRVSVTNSKQPYANGKTEFDSHPARSSSLPSSGEPSIAPHPKSYMEIMQMIQRGERPSNIREINDLPPNPNQQPSNPRLVPRAKPWEAANSSNQVTQSQPNGEGLNSKVIDNGVMYQFDGDNSVPWWQQKNPRITEIENEDELKGGSYGDQTYQRPIPRTWVPPQPPPVAMPEAVEAIRRPKTSILKEQGAENQSAPPLNEPTQELQKITEVSKSGGALEIKGDDLSMQTAQTTEIQEETPTN